MRELSREKASLYAIKADLAAIFHWSPKDIDDLHLDELGIYHGLAMERIKAFDGS